MLRTKRAALAAVVVMAIGPAAQAQDDDAVQLFLLRELRLNIDEIGRGDFTPATVLPDQPFGDIPVDYSRTDNIALAAFIVEISSAQRLELIQRCHVVIDNSPRYRLLDLAYCQSVHGIIRRPMA